MTRRHPILIVDGDSAMRETLREQLVRDDAFAVTEAATAREAETRLHAPGAAFDAIIMESALPDGDGHALCARWRERGFSMPIVLLNGADHDGPGKEGPGKEDTGKESVGHGPGQGAAAGDTITIAKPFRLSELMTRLRARLDTPQPAPAAPIVMIGPYAFSAEEKSLRLGGDTRIRLTEKETAILRFLHDRPERAVPRQELLREVWGYNPAVTTHTLETHIYRLRRKIAGHPDAARVLLTEAGGYRLAGPGAG